MLVACSVLVYLRLSTIEYGYYNNFPDGYFQSLLAIENVYIRQQVTGYRDHMKFLDHFRGT
jgi:hypothetical protein